MTACTGGTNTSKVYRADGQGSKSVANETDYDGQTSTQDTQDSKAKRQVPAQQITEQRRTKKVEQIEGLSIAPKRRPNDPIYVSLVPPVLDSKMQEAEKSKGSVERQIRSEFTSDPIIKLVEGDRSSSDKGKLRSVPSIADVEVAPKVSIKDVYVLQPKTGKPGKMTAVIFEQRSLPKNRLSPLPCQKPGITCKTWKSPSGLPRRLNSSSWRGSGLVSLLIDAVNSAL